jgi:LL-diaminopimelate aminotransferase
MTPSATMPNVKALYAQQCQAMETYIMFKIAQRVLDLTPSLTAKGRAPIRMSIGAPTVSPPKALREYLKFIIDEPGIHTYSVPKGEPFFREAVAKRIHNRFGVVVDANTEVCSLIGSKEGLAHLFQALITPHADKQQQDIILTPNPGYASYVDSIEVLGGHSYPTPLTPQNNYLPNLPAIMAELQDKGFDPKKVKAVIINYPSNPIGATAPFSYYEDVVAFARQHNILVISDNAYSEMVFPGEEKPHSILEVAGAKDIAIEFHSLSKPYAVTGWRLGFAVGNADAVGILAKVKGTVDSGLSKLMQKAAVFALQSPDCDQFIVDMNAVYQRNQALMLAGFKRLGWPVEELNPPKATFYLWLPIPPRYTLEQGGSGCAGFSTEVLEKSGVVLVPGTAFGTVGEGYVRLSLVNPESEFEAVTQRMDEDGFRF